jgi:hypothetical protein
MSNFVAQHLVNHLMLESIITSKTRIKLLLKFFLNSSNTSYLRDLSAEFGESTNAIRLELNHLEKAGLLNSRQMGNKKVFQANRKHPLFDGIRELLMRHTGIDQVIENVAANLPGLHSAWVVGYFARGVDNPVIELVLIGDNLDMSYLDSLVGKAEKLAGRKIRYMVAGDGEGMELLGQHPETLLLWQQNGLR